MLIDENNMLASETELKIRIFEIQDLLICAALYPGGGGGGGAGGDFIELLSISASAI
jgi:hypothetical protein